MYTPEQLNQILDELGLDPADTGARESARALLEQLASAQPNVPIGDQSFISRLRVDLQARVQVSTQAAVASAVEPTPAAAPAPSASYSQPHQSTNFLSMFMNKLLASALVVIVVLVGGGLWYIQQTDKPLFRSQQSGGTDQLLSGKYDVKSVAQESFGNLDKVAIVSATDAAKLNNSANSANNASLAMGQASQGLGAGQADGNGYAGISLANSPTTTETAPAPAPDKMIAPGEPYPGDQVPPYPGPISYTFHYEGSGSLPGLADTQPVLKRLKPDQPVTIISRIINLLSFGLIDLNKFQNVKLQNVSFIEDRDNGYGIYVDVQGGNVSMYQNYEKWLYPEGIPPVLVKDLPSDEEAIGIADKFLADYSVSREGYGKPRVVEQWRVAYEQASEADRANFYIPEQIQVVYPLLLEGKEVLDEGGNVYGMSVMVDVRTKRVVNLAELISKQFERSDYKGESDGKRILSVAENGGFRNYNYIDQNAKKVELRLETPTVQMVKIYYSADNYRTNSELYMPALVFPIKNWKENNYWRQTVIVPLVKSILDTDNQPPVQIMPMDVPVSSDGAGSSSGSAGSAVQGANTSEPVVMPEPRERGTEPPFTGKYVDNHEDGLYKCAACGQQLFASDAKFDSGTGWPSFTDPMNLEHVELRDDSDHGMQRTEVVCKRCGSHLGHVFDDGPADKGGKRYCINSCALNFEKK